MPCGVSPLTVRTHCVRIRFCPSPPGIVSLCDTGVSYACGISLLTVRTHCVRIRFCPSPPGIVT